MARKVEPGQLNDKQWAFVREYVVDRNATQAAIRAGYSAKTAQEQSSRLLSNAMIKAAVDEALRMVAEKTETEAEWVRRRLKEEADDRTEFATHAGRIRALELVGRLNNLFKEDGRNAAPQVNIGRIELAPLTANDDGNGAD